MVTYDYGIVYPFPYFAITRVEKVSACMTPPGSPQVGEPPHRPIDVILLNACEKTCPANPSPRHHQLVHKLDAAGIPSCYRQCVMKTMQ